MKKFWQWAPRDSSWTPLGGKDNSSNYAGFPPLPRTVTHLSAGLVGVVENEGKDKGTKGGKERSGGFSNIQARRFRTMGKWTKSAQKHSPSNAAGDEQAPRERPRVVVDASQASHVENSTVFPTPK